MPPKRVKESKETRMLIAKMGFLIEELQTFDNFTQSFTTTDQSVLEQLEIRLEQIKPILNQYKELYVQSMAESISSDDFQSFSTFQENYFRSIYRANSILKNGQPKTSPSPGGTLNRAESNTHNVKLPQLTIPPFSGNYIDWTSFYETFIALIDSNSDLTEVEKFFYLQNALKGPAKEVLNELTATADNYRLALKMLKDRYSNQKLLVFSHLEAIFESNKIQKESSFELRKFHDNLTRHLRALDNCQLSDEQFKASVISYLIKTKVDSRTASEFSKFRVKQIPTIDEINIFLSQRCEFLEDINSTSKSFSSSSGHNAVSKNCSTKNQGLKPQNNSKQCFVVSNTHSCILCKDNHLLFACPKFLNLSVKERFDEVNNLKICKNCLKHSSDSKCTSKYKCKSCQKTHNTLLCFSNASKTKSNEQPNNQLNNCKNPDTTTEPNQTLIACTSINSGQALLSTAIVRVKSKGNKWIKARCLLDSASQSSFITLDLCSKLNVEIEPISTSIRGINLSESKIDGLVKIKVSSLQNNYQFDLSCLTIPQITESIPLKGFNKSVLGIPNNIQLADPSFNKPSPIDILIGASHFYDLLCIGQISLGKNQPTLQKTQFGWVISGNLPSQTPTSNTNYMPSIVCTSINDNSPLSNSELQSSLTKFWETESIQPENKISLLSKEEQFCEKHFSETTKREQSGKFMVSIPFNSKITNLGNSCSLVLDRFYSLERKLQKDPALRSEYTKFIHDYIRLGHMTKVSPSLEKFLNSAHIISTIDGDVCLAKIPNFYLPHHAVIKSDSMTTKLRVVFDGSVKSDSNISINDTQIVGPVIQNELFTILLQFRQHKVALTGDCEKMYRMILVNPTERKFQLIFWRDNINDPIDTYQLNTITYGTASASYLATRCIQQLADLNQKEFPVTSNVIRSSFYMDDLLVSAETSEEIVKIKNELTSILASAGIPIRKFLSNDSKVISDLNSSNSDTPLYTIPLGERSKAKALGLSWNAISDMIYYNTQIKDSGPSHTKRSMLSTISQLFDPLGLLSPIVIKGKILIQKLWQLKLSWDESVPSLINSEWNEFKNQLFLLNSLQIPRCVVPLSSCQIELHGFSDSSSVAFGACIYVRCFDSNNQATSRLLCSKSRVAPLHTITIPRLELNAAVLLCQLMNKVKTSLSVDNKQIFLWTDSTIVLNWLHSAPNKYKTYVANLIAAAQELFSSNCWHHVKSEENPADLVSRGISASELLTNSLWWTGPSFLSDPGQYWKNAALIFDESDNSEAKITCLTSTSNSFQTNFHLFDKFSSFTMLQRVLAWILRFISNYKLPVNKRNLGFLSTNELQLSVNLLVKICQQESFPNEIKSLMNNQPLKSKSNILSLNPFLDENKLLRVGGRIKNSQFPFNKKYPLLLPKDHPLTFLIMRHYHNSLLHCGAQQLLAAVRERFWPISGKNVAKMIIHKCVKCFKTQPISNNPFMGDLPIKRLEFNTPVFYNTGLDYAGPILIKDRKTRGAKLVKSYICLFVCLVTRVIHLELVTDLSSNAFLAVFKRFIARRGKPHTISSDNAKNFVGANNQLKELYKFLQSKDTQDIISKHLNDQGIRWEFIIPRAPHQGGIWEGGIKSTKAHLKRVLGNTHLTFEDFYTLLTQIEAVLNSRPLSCLSSDPTDLNPLTPGHFLIGKALTTLPEPDLLPVNEQRLQLYQRIQRTVQHFWKRWSIEVVPDLQKRTKWFSHLPDLLQQGSLVLIKEDNTPPLSWALGRVLELHRAADGVIRSVTLRVAGGAVTKRSVHKLCVLPV